MKQTFGKDLLAGFVVFLVALPLCLGVAIASGVPPQMGLITGILGGLIAGSLSGCPLQVSGPAAGLVVLVFEIVHESGLGALGVVLMMAGLLQAGAGLLRAGKWFRAISPAVVYGMLAGIGVLIIASQFHVAFDRAPKANGVVNLLAIPEALLEAVSGGQSGGHGAAAMIGLLSIAAIFGWNRIRPEALKYLPGALVAILIAGLLSLYFRLEIRYVSVPHDLLSALRMPDLNWTASLGNAHYWTQAAAMAFIASTETLLSAAAVDRMVTASGRRNLRTDYDRELISQGVGNFMCGAIGGLPMTGVIVRSSANVQAGAQTRWSAVLHGGWLLATIVLAPQWLERIPTSALAAILVVTGWKLIDVDHIRKLIGYGWMPVAIYSVTLAGVVAVDLLTGVLLGMALTIAKMIYKASQLGIRLVEGPEGISDLYLTGSATFLRLPELADKLEQVRPATELRIHIADLTYLDHSCLDLLEDWRKTHEDEGGTLTVDWDELVRRFTHRAI